MKFNLYYKKKFTRVYFKADRMIVKPIWHSFPRDTIQVTKQSFFSFSFVAFTYGIEWGLWGLLKQLFWNVSVGFLMCLIRLTFPYLIKSSWNDMVSMCFKNFLLNFKNAREVLARAFFYRTSHVLELSASIGIASHAHFQW